MSPRAFQVLLWSTIIAALAAFWFVRADGLTDGSRVAGTESFAPFAGRVGDVTKISVETADYSVAFEKKGEAWVASDRGDYPLRSSAVANVLTSLSAMKLVERKTLKPELYKEIGVEDRTAGAGSIALGFEYAGGVKAGSVLIGKRANSASFDQTGSTFVRRLGDRQAWLALGAPSMPRDFSEWFNELPAIPAAEVQRVTISEGERVLFDAKRNDDGLYGRVDGAEPPANDTNVKRVAQALVGTGFEDVRPASAIAALKRNIRLELSSGQMNIAIGDIGGQNYVVFDGAAQGAAGEVIKQSNGFAFRLPNYRMSGLTQSLADMTAREEAGTLPPGALPSGMMPQNMPQGLPPGFIPPGEPRQ